jgi:uncharacterized C2H2 Zn-finger protein
MLGVEGIFSNGNDLESKADIALVSLSKSQDNLASPSLNLRRSQRRIEKDDALAASSSFPAPLDYSLGLNRSQFLDPFDMNFGDSNVNLTGSQGIGARLRSSKGGALETSQSIKQEPSLSKSQEIRRGLRVSNTLNKSDAFEFDESSSPKPVSHPMVSLSYEEMKVLAERLVSLSATDLQYVLDFVRRQEPAVIQAQEDAGLQFDLGTLKHDTLFSIKTFVEKRAEMAATATIVMQDVSERDEYLPPRGRAGKTVPRAAVHVMNMDPNTMECPECHKRFADKSNLAKHVRTHTGAKPFVCEQCGKSFRHSSTLKDHLNTHEEIRPYACHFEGCGKRFSNMANLKRHERTHTNLKPFVCQFCQRPFNQSSNCKQHEKKCGGSTSAIKRAIHNEPDDDYTSLNKKPRMAPMDWS